VPIKTLPPYTHPGNFYADTLTVVNDTVFFVANGDDSEYELWMSDGTEEGTKMVADLRPGSNSSEPDYLTAVGNTLFFSADDGNHGHELWKVDLDFQHQPGDTDGDGDVDLGDLNNVRNHFGAIGANVIGDTNHDDRVDLADLNAVRNNFGASAPSPMTASSPVARILWSGDHSETARLSSRFPNSSATIEQQCQATDALFNLLSKAAGPPVSLGSHRRGTGPR